MDNALENLSSIQDLVDLNEFMADENFAEACEIALKCIAKPDIPVATVLKTMVKMQGYAFTFRMQGQAYMTIKKGPGGSDANHKKNVYFSVSEQCHELAQTLKYLVRTYH